MHSLQRNIIIKLIYDNLIFKRIVTITNVEEQKQQAEMDAAKSKYGNWV
jgi:hypothetical protein